MSEVTTYRPPSRRPGRESLEKLLGAAEEQLRQEELDFFTVDRVLERAGVSVGSFYARFPEGKDALLNAVQDRMHGRMQSVVDALDPGRYAGQPIEAAVDHVFGALIESTFSDRRLARAFMMFSAFNPTLRHKSQQMNIKRRDAVMAVLACHRAEIAHPDPEAAVRRAFSVFQSMINGRLLFFAPHPELSLGMSDEEMFAELKAWICSYLRGGASGGSKRAGETAV